MLSRLGRMACYEVDCAVDALRSLRASPARTRDVAWRRVGSRVC